jgi:hypothetical protein
MTSPSVVPPVRGRRMLSASLLTIALVAGTAFAAWASVANLQEPFSGVTLLDPSRWNASALDEPVCLTARSADDADISLGSGVVAGCFSPQDVDAPGQGVLSLTRAEEGQANTFLYNAPLSMADGIDITFTLSMWGGTGADGISFFLKDGANTDDTPGAPGGALGYGLSDEDETAGIQGALVGIGFDVYGNFSTEDPALDCTSPVTTGNRGGSDSSNTVVVRGPDLSADQDGTCGYYLLDSAPHDFGSAGSRAEGARDVRVLIDKPSLAAPKIRVFIGEVGSPLTEPLIEVDQPAVFRTTSTFKFGWSASTGGSDNNHEIWGLRIGSSAAPSTPASGSAPLLSCSPDPYRAGETVTCTVSNGPPNSDILWNASGDGTAFAGQGVRLDANGSGTFTFTAPSASGTLVELVGWGVTDTLSRTGTQLPTRIAAGGGPVQAPVLLAVLTLALFGLLYRRAQVR